jgi:hypothetical protein
MKSIKTQYIDLMEGRMSQHNFMRSLRMSLPQYITNVTSFKDSVRILKNKGILSENMDIKDEDEEFIDMITKAEEEESGKYNKFDDFEGGLSEKAHEGLKIEWDWDNADVDYDTDEEGNEGAFGTVFGRDEKGHAYSARFDAPVMGGDVDFDSADVSSIEKTEDASELYEGKKKRKPKAELHPNQIHPQELRMGIKVELEHTDDLDKAKKIALDHLAENPFYYTALKLSGIESPSAPKAKAPVAFKKEVAAAVELVDKTNAMKPVKGFEKAKASSNKAKKETNSGVKGVSELTHNAKSVRGLQKFKPTGGKMKTIKSLQEAKLNIRGEPNEIVKKAMGYVDGPNANPTLKALSDKIEFQQNPYNPDEAILRYDYWNILPQEAVEKLALQFNVMEDSDEMDDQLPIHYYRLKLKPSANKGLGASLEIGANKANKIDAFKESLEKLVRKVMNEIADGGDDMNPQYAENEY